MQKKGAFFYQSLRVQCSSFSSGLHNSLKLPFVQLIFLLQCTGNFCALLMEVDMALYSLSARVGGTNAQQQILLLSHKRFQLMS
jgi:hypothetical protein